MPLTCCDHKKKRSPSFQGTPFLTHQLVRLHLDFDVDATWKIQSHQSIDGFVGWLVDVDETIVRPQLEVLHRLLVDVWATDDAEASKVGWEWYWTLNSGTGSLCGVNNFLSALIYRPVVV